MTSRFQKHITLGVKLTDQYLLFLPHQPPQDVLLGHAQGVQVADAKFLMPMTSRFQKHITLGGQTHQPIPPSPPPPTPQGCPSQTCPACPSRRVKSVLSISR